MSENSFNPDITPSQKPLDRSDVVAVYGSLKKGKGNHPLLKEATYIGQDFARGTMFSLGGFPGVVTQHPKVPDTGNVLVELYELNSEITGIHLDGLEGYRIGSPDRSMYIRGVADLLSKRENVYMYYWNSAPRGEIVDKGVW